MPHLQPLTTAFAVGLLALTPLCASAAWNSDSATAPFEIDVIFPRNETYKPTGVFPISLAVQNYTALRAAGNFSLSWHIMPYSYGRIPGGITWDEGDFETNNSPDDNDTVVFVANTNVTEWIHQKDRDDRFRLQWHLEWDFRNDCDYKGSYVFGGIMFSIETEQEAIKSPGGKGIGKRPNVLDVPECPVLGSVVLLRNTTDICSRVLDMGNNTAEGTPCAFTVDKALASSISSQAASSATSAFLATASPTQEPEPTETNAAPSNSPEFSTFIVLGAIMMLYGLA
ncbi:hypothetical protein NCS57_00954600 [Fusarium keratoplasticum]|uniref:Uncharacterized protein n=1 Tax=Fusarium keratoplasticum TaxID=1328300 RepID=A0ACC0QU45_9HYPO|nr:hypothetical protein NCS57_00954600 [Fusarium keratoplasticum]KAI8663533.1 hypothetical protein NCS57_00954600 [Fusarium keratoplasticum]